MDMDNLKNIGLLGMTFVILGTGAGVAASKHGIYIKDYIPGTEQITARIDFFQEQAAATLASFEMPTFAQWQMPEINLPEIGMPKIAMPEIKAPALPDWPEITWHHKIGNYAGSVYQDTLGGLNRMGASIAGGYNAAIEYAENLSVSLQNTKTTISALNTIEPQAGVAEEFNAPPDSMNLHFAGLEDDKPALFQDGIQRTTADNAARNAEDTSSDAPKYPAEEKSIEAEGVLVPQRSTIISSSRDGKIAQINVDDGDIFRKDDVLIEYECADIKAEFDAAQAEQDFSNKRTLRNEKLFRLDIISDIEHLGIKTEDLKAQAQARIVESRMEQCKIRAAYDGRVTKRLANEHEYTRSDRVLMEVGSLEDLEIEFLLPSKWLRWVNIGAPLTVTISETGDTYKATIKRIHGEVDPVSQSIQLGAALDAYTAPLLPGMSGTISLSMDALREAGIKGFLETPRLSDASNPPAE